MIDLKEIAKTITKEEFMDYAKLCVDPNGENILRIGLEVYECPDECGIHCPVDCINEERNCSTCWNEALGDLEFKETKISKRKNTYTLQEIYEISSVTSKDRTIFKSIDGGLTMFFDNDDIWAISGEICGKIPLTMKHISGRYIIVEEENIMQFPEAMELLQQGKIIRSKVTNNQYNIVNGILHRNGKPLLPKHTSSILYEEIIGEWVVD